MEVLPVPNVDMNLDVLEENPEAIFDFLTIKSLQDRQVPIASPRQPLSRKQVENEPIYQNDAEFETYVQQFPIDDSISECFALAVEPERVKPQPKFVSGGKRPQVSSKYNKLKKKFGLKHSTDENIPLDDEDHVTRESKRSKKGGVFSKRHKWRGLGSSKKGVQFPDQSPSPNSDDVKMEIPPRVINMSPNDSNSISDSQITSYSETLTPNDQKVPLMRLESSPVKSDMQGMVNYSAGILGSGDEQFACIFSGETTMVIQNLEEIRPDDAARMRDPLGNTLLHHAVTIGNADAVKFIIEKYPEMTSDMNVENMTAVELAAKFGKYDCLRVMLDRKRKSPGSSLINRLLNISAQFGQVECLNLLLSYMSRDPQSGSSLPGDTRGNTAAHLAAKNGHLHCLQTLLAAGYDITSENLIHQRPLHIAHQNRNETCFSYLLLLNVCEDLLRLLKSQINPSVSQEDLATGLNTNLEQIHKTLHRYQELLSNVRQSLDESRRNILMTLSDLQNDLDLFIQHTDCDTAYKRKKAREKLDELQSHQEELADIFEFSPLAEMEDTMTKMLSELETTLTPLLDRDHPHKKRRQPQSLEVSMAEEELGLVLSTLIKDIYKEYMLENWNVSHVFRRHVGSVNSQNGSEGLCNTSSELDSSCERLPVMTSTLKMAKRDDNPYLNMSVANQASQTDFNETVCNKCESNKIDKELLDDIGDLYSTSSKTHTKKKLFKHKTESSNDEYVEADEIKSAIDINRCSPTEEKISQSEQTMSFTNNNGNTTDTNTALEPTERPFARLLTLNERMDLLISGERSKQSDNSDNTIEKSGSPEAPESLYTTTFTSITSESTSGLSDWYSKLGFSSLDTSPSDVTHDITSETTPSYWWDTGEERDKAGSSQDKRSTRFEDELRHQVHLNLENEDSSLEELRRNRLLSHLHSVQQTRYPSGNYTEKITTASGQVIGGFASRDSFTSRDGFTSRDEATRKIVVDVKGALKCRSEFSSGMNADGVGHDRLYTLEDAINSKQPETTESYGIYNVRSRDLFEGPPGGGWDETSCTDDEDTRSIPWYEMAEHNSSLLWRSDGETSDGTVTPQSYV